MTTSEMIREPFVQFAVLGLALFGLWGIVGEAEDNVSSDLVVIELKDEELQMLRLGFVERQGRDPSSEELDDLLEERVGEELLYREGLAAGLHLGDPVVRRRIIQKQRFLLEELRPPVEPTEAEVDKQLSSDPERYRSGAAVAFVHHFYDGERRHNPQEDARRALTDLEASGTPPAGDPFVHGEEFGLRALDAHRDQLGASFVGVLAEAAEGAWLLAPSRWGWHLVKVTQRVAAEDLTEVSVRAQARFDLIEARRAAGVEEGIEAARDRYEVRVEGRE